MNEQAASAFTRIVVPLDGSTLADQALPFAQAVGGETAELTLATVLTPRATRSVCSVSANRAGFRSSISC